jgi:hypothetical protein
MNRMNRIFILERKDGNMDEKKEHKKLAMTSTKQEMLHAYNTLLKQMEEKQAGELKPEKKIEEKKTKEALQVAESLTTEEVAGEIGNLKIDIGKTLTRIADQMEGEVNRFVAIRNAIAAKETELRELYEIEKEAMTLAALIEAQNQKRQEFTDEMETQKSDLRQEIETTRAAWEKEQEERDGAVKETSERLLLETRTREELLKKEYEGERNVHKTRIDSLEKTAKEQGERITALTTQLEAAYQKVQDIALKTVEGASNSKSVASLQQLLGEQMRKQTAEK